MPLEHPIIIFIFNGESNMLPSSSSSAKASCLLESLPLPRGRPLRKPPYLLFPETPRDLRIINLGLGNGKFKLLQIANWVRPMQWRWSIWRAKGIAAVVTPSEQVDEKPETQNGNQKLGRRWVPSRKKKSPKLVNEDVKR